VDVGARQLPVAEEGETSLRITSADLILEFDKKTGNLMSVGRAGKTIALTNGPRLAAGQAQLQNIAHRAEGSDYLVNLTYSGDLKSVTWRIMPNSQVQLDYAYQCEGAHDYFGVCFDLPERSVKGIKWLGDGPYRVWKNRMLGGALNVWQNSFNDTMTGFDGWIYPEFMGYYSGVRWMKFETTGGPILLSLQDPKLFVQVLRPRFPGDPQSRATTRANDQLSGNAWAAFPDAGLSFLHAIPPVGSKFRTAASTGPQGQQNQASGEYRVSVRFRFGE
jgi:hypothetical protein